MRSRFLLPACVLAVLARVATPATAVDLRVVSAAPQGVLTGDEQQRIQIVFSAAMAPLGEATPMNAPPAWLRVEPPILAAWRWAGTAELVGEPLAPLPRATRYGITVAAGTTAVDGGSLTAPFTFSFTTPLPDCTVMLAPDGGIDALDELPRFRHGDRDRGERELALGQPLALVWNQPIDAGSLSGLLAVTIVPRPLEGAADILDKEQVTALQTQDQQGFAGWQRVRAAARR